MAPSHDGNFYRDPERDYPVIERTEGIHVQDAQGRRYVDFGSGIGVTSIGAGAGDVLDRMRAQMQKGTFVFNGYFTNEPRRQLASKLLALCPAGMGGVIFVSGGSEANEVAIKIARQYHLETGNASKFKVISRRKSYHGNTLTALSVSDRESWSKLFQPYLHDFPKISAPYCYRCPLALEYPSCELRCARELDDVIGASGPEQVSAFIAEPVVGTTLAGITPPGAYYDTIRSICDRHAVLFIADEIITGLGRTGRNFGLDHWHVAPDIITLGKGLAAGYAPLGAVIVSERIVRAIREGSGGHTQGFTYSGNPLSCAAGLAVLQHLEDHDLVRQAERRGAHLKAQLERLEDIPIVGDVRGLGMFCGVEFVRDRRTREPLPAGLQVARRIVDRAFELGLIVIAGLPGCADGVNGDQLQISPAFIFSEQEIEQSVRLLREAIETVAAEIGQAG